MDKEIFRLFHLGWVLVVCGFQGIDFFLLNYPFMGIKLFKVFSCCVFNVCRICADILFFTPDTGNLCFIFLNLSFQSCQRFTNNDPFKKSVFVSLIFFSFFFFTVYLINKVCIYVRCTTWWFNVHIQFPVCWTWKLQLLHNHHIQEN